MKEAEAAVVLAKISEHLPERVIAIQIGGNALVFHRLKNATMDIDLVLSTGGEKVVLPAIYAAGFKELTRFTEPPFIRAVNAAGETVDLFFRNVGTLHLTNGIMRRAIALPEFPNILVASKEDVFVFKAITERHEDLDDLKALIQSGLDFQVIARILDEQPERATIVSKMRLTLERLRGALNIEVPQLSKILR